MRLPMTTRPQMAYEGYCQVDVDRANLSRRDDFFFPRMGGNTESTRKPYSRKSPSPRMRGSQDKSQDLALMAVCPSIRDLLFRGSQVADESERVHHLDGEQVWSPRDTVVSEDRLLWSISKGPSFGTGRDTGSYRTAFSATCSGGRIDMGILERARSVKALPSRL